MDWATFSQTGTGGMRMASIRNDVPRINGFGSGLQTSGDPIIIDGVTHKDDNTTILSLWRSSDGADDNGSIVFVEIGIVTYSNTGSLHGKLVRRYRHGNFSSGGYGKGGKEWETL